MKKRNLLPLGGGSSFRGRLAASPGVELSAGAPSVTQYSAIGAGGPSLTIIDLPSASCPVTIRRKSWSMIVPP